jgi:hypothetical protein
MHSLRHRIASTLFNTFDLPFTLKGVERRSKDLHQEVKILRSEREQASVNPFSRVNRPSLLALRRLHTPLIIALTPGFVLRTPPWRVFTSFDVAIIEQAGEAQGGGGRPRTFHLPCKRDPECTSAKCQNQFRGTPEL